MIDCDDYFGGLTEEEYAKATEEHFAYIEHICRCNDKETEKLLKRYKESLFASEFINDEEAEMLYHTILSWLYMAKTVYTTNEEEGKKWK